MAVAVLVSAAKPWAGLTSVSPEPMVRMIRQPPEYVPSAMAKAQAVMTQTRGPEPAAGGRAEIRARVMMPIVFWASLVPWASATRLDVKIWPARKPPRFCVSLSPVSGHGGRSARTPAGCTSRPRRRR